MLIPLSSLAGKTDLVGSTLGRQVFDKLRDIVVENSHQRLFSLSAKGIRVSDATFARDSVLALARQYRGHRAFCIVDINDQDQLDIWSYAADNQGQPLMAWNGDQCVILGAQLTKSGLKVMDFVLSRSTVSVSEVAIHLDITVPNASTTLKKLQDQGYMIRTEERAPTGGIEYFYHSISPSRRENILELKG